MRSSAKPTRRAIRSYHCAGCLRRVIIRRSATTLQLALPFWASSVASSSSPDQFDRASPDRDGPHQRFVSDLVVQALRRSAVMPRPQQRLPALAISLPGWAQPSRRSPGEIDECAKLCSTGRETRWRSAPRPLPVTVAMVEASSDRAITTVPDASLWPFASACPMLGTPGVFDER